MDLKITRRLVEKRTTSDGVEHADVSVPPTDLARIVKVKSWNERFFEVIVIDADVTQDVAFASAAFVSDGLDEGVSDEG